jgi:hypothetical protein
LKIKTPTRAIRPQGERSSRKDTPDKAKEGLKPCATHEAIAD